MWPSDAVWNEFDDETFNWGGLERFSRTLSRDNSLPLTPEEWRNFIKKIAIPPNKFLINKMIKISLTNFKILINLLYLVKDKLKINFQTNKLQKFKI